MAKMSSAISVFIKVLFLKKMFFFVCFSGLTFEKAYCEYRLNRVSEALKTLRSVGDNLDNRCQELLGQVVSHPLHHTLQILNFPSLKYPQCLT